MERGLGLSIVYSVVSKHHGFVTVESEVGRGTTFRVRIPSIALPRNREEPHREDPRSQTPGKLLVLDDEALIRTTLATLLGNFGYQVQAVGEAAEALSLFHAARSTRCPFTQVLLDLTLSGGVSGFDVAREMRAADPHVWIVIMSGYSNEIANVGPNAAHVDGFLEKSLSVEALARALEQGRDRQG